jgi:hypothetical protein
MKRMPVFRALSLLLLMVVAVSAVAQITPSDDSYTLTSSPTVNFGAKTTLEVESAGATTFVRFNLSGIPSTVSGAMVAKATMKVYVGTVTTAGSFNVDLITSTWTESAITANDSPTLGTAIASAVPVSKADKNQYVLVDVTTAVVDWLNGTANDGLAIVPDGAVSFALNSKETTTTSHPPELDLVLTGPAGPPGSITGVTAGPGLTGGGTKGSVKLSLLTSCTSGQVLQWNGTTWACATATGSGTITGVTAGTDLTGGGSNGAVTLNVDITKIPQLATANTFAATQSINGNLNVTSSAFQPVTVQSSNGFGTWLALVNSSTGGHTWNILSAGAGNAEGAGNLGISDLTGKSTIWLEGNTNTTNLTASGSAGGAIVDADVQGKNNGAFNPGLRFGGGASGEGIVSNRTGGVNAFGLQLFTEFAPRISILQGGLVGVGTTEPMFPLDVAGTFPAIVAINAQGASAPRGSGSSGGTGIFGVGGSGDAGSAGGTDGTGGFFVGGMANFGGDGMDSTAGSSGVAGDFSGDVTVEGTLSKSGGSFKIDHPLDPANKYLYHSFVESPDMMNIYNGNVVTDSDGAAIIPLPEWFETLNRDFRYQLTVIGQFAQAIVSTKVSNHQFSIKTDKPNVEVSWQVTGIRQDAWANQHRIPVEEQKDTRERGHYIHPELYGAPEEASVAWARHPATMKHIKDIREKEAREKSSPVATAASVARP